MKPDVPVLRRADYFVDSAPMQACSELVGALHYAGGGPNTATFRHGLYRVDNFMECLGIAWWLPPTRPAAEYAWPQNWLGVLTLSRLVIDPLVPQNGASFLLGQSVRLIRQDPRWQCLVTYADEAEGHTGAIYRAAGWEEYGRTSPEPRWIDAHGRMVARKAGPTTRTAAEMRALGCRIAGVSCKIRFRRALVPEDPQYVRDAA